MGRGGHIPLRLDSQAKANSGSTSAGARHPQDLRPLHTPPSQQPHQPPAWVSLGLKSLVLTSPSPPPPPPPAVPHSPQHRVNLEGLCVTGSHHRRVPPPAPAAPGTTAGSSLNICQNERTKAKWSCRSLSAPSFSGPPAPGHGDPSFLPPPGAKALTSCRGAVAPPLRALSPVPTRLPTPAPRGLPAPGQPP